MQQAIFVSIVLNQKGGVFHRPRMIALLAKYILKCIGYLREFACRTMLSMPPINIAHIVVNQHAPIFDDLIALTIDGLKSSSSRVTSSMNRLAKDQLNLVIGYTFAFPRSAFGDAPYIIFQLEPLGEYSGNALPKDCEYFEILRGAKQIWDYSPLNIQYLSEQGIKNVRYIPVGYSPRLQKVDDKVVQDLDVLFFGTTSPRRVEILEALRARNIKTGVLFAGYGADRDAYIARARIQLNIHKDETAHLEQLRIAYLLNNKRFVISETSDHNPYGEGVVFCDSRDIVERCLHYLKLQNAAERLRIAKAGHKNLQKIPMAKAISTALRELA